MKQYAHQLWKQAAQMAQEAANQPHLYEQWVTQLASRDVAIATPAMWALQQAGSVVIPTLLVGLQHQHTRVRRSCVDIIDHGGYGADARCIQALLPLLHDPVPHIRRAVWHTLFCERCPDVTKCEITTLIQLDHVALLLEIGVNDPNPRLRQQLVGSLGDHLSDPRAQHALQQILADQNDPILLSIAQQALAGDTRPQRYRL
jgi:HEAT repeat protein